MANCPTPTLRAYPAEGAAWAAARVESVDTGTLLPYRCGCGSWHVAPAAEAMRKRRAARA